LSGKKRKKRKKKKRRRRKKKNRRIEAQSEQPRPLSSGKYLEYQYSELHTSNKGNLQRSPWLHGMASATGLGRMADQKHL
jgi:hypothetical protein